jgi:hypothetical protein
MNNLLAAIFLVCVALQQHAIHSLNERINANQDTSTKAVVEAREAYALASAIAVEIKEHNEN